jgi:GDPmannose 4,6-dehydratase
MKKIIVTGVTGQVGSYMTDFLLKNTDFEIYGAIRRLSVPNHENIAHIKSERFHLIGMDLSDEHSISSAIEEIKPDYFINFAANSFVGTSWKMPAQHFQVNALGVMHQLEAIRKYCPKCRYYNAGSSEEFGDVQYSPQDMNHPPRARSPYGASKVAARQIVKVWRDSYDLYAVQGLLFNHESERRGEEFVTRKITKGVARIKREIEAGDIPTSIKLGNLKACRDWSHAEDFVRGVWLMLNQDRPKDYLLASGETHSIGEFVQLAFEAAGIYGFWEGEGLDETFVINIPSSIYDDYRWPIVKINPAFYRPAEVDLLLGDPSEIIEELGWERLINFESLVERMVEHDIKLLDK